MGLEQSWLELVSGQTRGPSATARRAALEALSGLYCLGLKGNLALYTSGLKPHTRAVLPVISVGNLTVGGAGKSTSVRFLARELLARGLKPGVVLRGHRREGGAEVLLASDGQGNVSPVSECGDEAAEVARALPQVPVGVGKRREQVIALLAGHGVQVALLDDGYQYFRMARDLNIALISARLDLRTARLLPRGVLREPWAHLDRADQVWLTHTDLASDEQLAAVEAIVARHAPGVAVLHTKHQPQTLTGLENGMPRPLTDLAGARVLAVSGLGSPESFEGSLAGLGAEVRTLRFPDHHPYTQKDWSRISDAAGSWGGMAVTTEKDAVKLPLPAPLPVWVLRTELRVISQRGALVTALDKLCEDL